MVRIEPTRYFTMRRLIIYHHYLRALLKDLVSKGDMRFAENKKAIKKAICAGQNPKVEVRSLNQH